MAVLKDIGDLTSLGGETVGRPWGALVTSFLYNHLFSGFVEKQNFFFFYFLFFFKLLHRKIPLYFKVERMRPPKSWRPEHRLPEPRSVPEAPVADLCRGRPAGGLHPVLLLGSVAAPARAPSVRRGLVPPAPPGTCLRHPRALCAPAFFPLPRTHRRPELRVSPRL